MNRMILISVLLVVTFGLGTMQSYAQKRPNIVILFADDLGYSDIACYGGEIETPNLDKLASKGIRFTQFMSCTKCAASRAALLTGLYPVETACNGEPTQMINSMTIAELLKKANYKTLMAGKWHAKENPVKRGFDHYFGSVNGAFDYFEPKARKKYMLDDKVLAPYKPENPATYYTTDAFTNKALEYLDDCKNSEDPFFLYVAYNAPHWPLQAWPEDIAKYRGKYGKGWDQVRKERFERQQALGIVKPGWKLSERDENVEAWENFSRKDAADLTMATYAAMIDRMDQNIGKILNKLDDMGVADNTLVIFLSDNGACAEGAMWDGKDKATKPGWRNSQAKLGIEWANASNTPYRKFKRYMYNGGQLTPFIVRWPQGVSDQGSITHERAHLVDLVPTILELAEGEYPANQKHQVSPENDLKTEWNVLPLAGKSIVPLFKGEPAPERDNFLGYFQGARMITKKQWKLVSDGSDGTIQHLEEYAWELYNMDEDPAELNNLVEKYPAMVESMDNTYREWMFRADSVSGVSNHTWFVPRFTKKQHAAANQLASDARMQNLLAKRKVIGEQIVKALNAEQVKMKTGLGMEKVPMSYFGLVKAGEPFANTSDTLKELYEKWNKNIQDSEQYCKAKGEVYLQAWNVQERIRPMIPAYDIEKE